MIERPFKLEARKPGGEWGVRSELREINASRLSDEEKLSAANRTAQIWAETVKDDTEYRVTS